MSWRCTYHVAWDPEYRRGVLVGAVEIRLEALLQDIARDLTVSLREIELMSAHVHVLMDVDPQLASSASCGYEAHRDVNAARNIYILPLGEGATGRAGPSASGQVFKIAA